VNEDTKPQKEEGSLGTKLWLNIGIEQSTQRANRRERREEAQRASSVRICKNQYGYVVNPGNVQESVGNLQISITNFVQDLFEQEVWA
jgi:hypothetical protein